MRLGTARLRGILPSAQHILVIECGERPAHRCRLERRRLSAALWPRLALWLLPRLLAHRRQEPPLPTSTHHQQEQGAGRDPENEPRFPHRIIRQAPPGRASAPSRYLPPPMRSTIPRDTTLAYRLERKGAIGGVPNRSLVNNIHTGSRLSK